MKDLDTGRIDRILRAFFKDNNINCTAELDTDFYYYYNSQRIGYALVVAERTAKLYPDFCKANGLQYEVPIFILCLLHEVGHHFTTDMFSDDEVCDLSNKKDLLGDSDEDFCRYFAIEDEYEATMWAINFINTHPSQIKLLDLSLEQAFAEFIAVNEIDG